MMLRLEKRVTGKDRKALVSWIVTSGIYTIHTHAQRMRCNPLEENLVLFIDGEGVFCKHVDHIKVALAWWPIFPYVRRR